MAHGVRNRRVTGFGRPRRAATRLWADVAISGGTVGDDFSASGSRVTISGGTIGNNFLIEECGGWRTGQPTISELLFIIQNHLSHPNPKSPAQAEAYYCYNRSRQDYNAKARELAAMYTKEKFLENALSSGIQDGKLILVDDEAIQDAYDCDSECICSCCTLRLSTEPSHWDERRDMRLLFGIGG